MSSSAVHAIVTGQLGTRHTRPLHSALIATIAQHSIPHSFTIPSTFPTKWAPQPPQFLISTFVFFFSTVCRRGKRESMVTPAFEIKEHTLQCPAVSKVPCDSYSSNSSLLKRDDDSVHFVHSVCSFSFVSGVLPSEHRLSSILSLESEISDQPPLFNPTFHLRRARLF